LKKNKNQRIISLGYFSGLKEAKVFMQELLVFRAGYGKVSKYKFNNF
jgi:hypothetical protein